MAHKGVTVQVPFTLVYDDDKTDEDGAVDSLYEALAEANLGGLFGHRRVEITYGEERDRERFDPEHDEEQPAEHLGVAERTARTAVLSLKPAATICQYGSPICGALADLVYEVRDEARRAWTFEGRCQAHVDHEVEVFGVELRDRYVSPVGNLCLYLLTGGVAGFFAFNEAEATERLKGMDLADYGRGLTLVWAADALHAEELGRLCDAGREEVDALVIEWRDESGH